MVVQRLFFLFLPVLFIASWRQWLCYLVTKTKTLGTKRHSSQWRSMNASFYDLTPKETCIAKWKKKLPAKKNYSKSKKDNVTRDICFLLFLFCWFWTGSCWLSNFLYFFFPQLFINHKHKCIQANTLETQISWSLDSCTH